MTSPLMIREYSIVLLLRAINMLEEDRTFFINQKTVLGQCYKWELIFIAFAFKKKRGCLSPAQNVQRVIEVTRSASRFCRLKAPGSWSQSYTTLCPAWVHIFSMTSSGEQLPKSYFPSYSWWRRCLIYGKGFAKR